MLRRIKNAADLIGARVVAWALRSDDDIMPADTLFWAIAASGANVTREYRDEPADGDPERIERILRIRVPTTNGQRVVCYDYDASGRWLRGIRALPVEALF